MAQTAAAAAATSAQTIEGFVGEQMDNARMGPLHWRVLALVAGGYFCDVIDFTIFGALVPDLLKSGFVTQQQVPWVGSATALGMVIGTLGQGEFTDRFGRKAVYQFNPFAIWTGDNRCRPAADPEHRLRPRSLMAYRLSLHRRRRARRRAAALLLLHRRIRAKKHPRPPDRVHAVHRRRLAMAGRRAARHHVARFDRLARHLDHHRHRRADHFRVALLAAGIAALAGDAWPGTAGARHPAAHGIAHRAARIAERWRGERYQERSDRPGSSRRKPISRTAR
jgi:hypothetical protein